MFNQPRVQKLASFFAPDFEVRPAGGCVRDHLLGKPHKDLDFCTNATPDQMLALADKHNVRVLPTGLDHGTVTFMVDGEPFEVTTLRVDVACDGRHAQVAWTQSWKEDAARRDLTINAMMMDMQGNLFDWFGGQEDLKNGVVRFVGNAEDRVREDFLRVLRFFRFANKFDRVPVFCEQGLAACEKLREGLRSVSAERVWAEMSKVLVGQHADRVLQEMARVGVLDVLGFPSTTQAVLKGDSARRCGGTPAQVLGAMMQDSVEDVDMLCRSLKMSNVERAEAVWAANDKLTNFQVVLADFEDALVNGTNRQWVVWAAKTRMRFDWASHLTSWDVPQFPVSGKHLLDAGMKPGPAMGVRLMQLRHHWMVNRFQPSVDELMALPPV